MENKPTKDKLIFEDQMQNPNFLRQCIKAGGDPMPHLLMSIADGNVEGVKACLEMVDEKQDLTMALVVALKVNDKEIKHVVACAINERREKEQAALSRENSNKDDSPMFHLLMSIADGNMEGVKVYLEKIDKKQNLNIPLLVALKGNNTEIKLAVLNAFNERQKSASKQSFIAKHDNKQPRGSQNTR